MSSPMPTPGGKHVFYSYHIIRTHYENKKPSHPIPGRAVAPVQPSSTEHNRGFTRASGFVIRRRRPVKKFIRCRNATVKKTPKSPWMFSRHLRKYLGCSLRHIYWLIVNRGFPHYIHWSSRTRRYMFHIYEVDAWLRRYRGKGEAAWIEESPTREESEGIPDRTNGVLIQSRKF